MRAEEQRDYWKKAKDATFIHCPFCGARQDADRAHWWGVRCGNCGATGPSYPPRREKGYSQEAEDAFDPIAAWNKRAASRESELLQRAASEMTHKWTEAQAELTALRELREACRVLFHRHPISDRLYIPIRSAWTTDLEVAEKTIGRLLEGKDE